MKTFAHSIKFDRHDINRMIVLVFFIFKSKDKNTCEIYIFCWLSLFTFRLQTSRVIIYYFFHNMKHYLKNWKFKTKIKHSYLICATRKFFKFFFHLTFFDFNNQAIKKILFLIFLFLKELKLSPSLFLYFWWLIFFYFM